MQMLYQRNLNDDALKSDIMIILGVPDLAILN